MKLKLSIVLVVFFLSWMSCGTKNKISFSADELKWLKEHSSITLSVDNTYPPLNYTNNLGQLTGLNIDLIRLIENNLGIPIVLEGSSWSEALEKAMNHQVDGVVNATPLNSRRHRLNFTTSFTQDPQALLCKKSLENSTSFKGFMKRKVAAKSNSRQLVLLKSKVPEENIIEIETLFEGIDLLLRGEIDGLYDDLAPLYHIISTSNMNNLNIAIVENNGEGSSIGLRNNDPILLSIMNKAINSISFEQKNQIRERWLQIGIQDYKKYYFIIGTLFLIAILALVWIRVLKVTVEGKTKQLMNELEERKRIENELYKAKEKAEESDRLKSAFLANMSHEIRTPMNGIIGFSEMLTNLNLTDDLKKKYSKIIVESGEQLLSIVNDILDISRIEAEKVEVVKEVVNINFLFNELFEVFSLKTNRKGITLLQDKGLSDVDCYIYTDKVKLKQVLSNLLSNAIKFTRKGYVKFGYEVEKDMMKFYVEDTGIGINMETRAKIFDRFRQAELDVTRQYGGTGLGLSISEKLLKLLGGNIWVESKQEQGSTFYFNIPFLNLKINKPENAGNQLTTNKTHAKIMKSTILVVEDEETNYLLVYEILRATGAKIIHAKNGQEAIDMCESNLEIDIVLMDIKLPVVNGYDATIKIKEKRPTLPIIAQTAYALSGDQDKAMKAGCDDYIAKPIKKDVLLNKINKFLS